MTEKRIVTSIRIDGGYEGSSPEEVRAFIEKMCLNIPPMDGPGMPEVTMGTSSSLVLTINLTNHQVCLKNMSRKEACPSVLGKFPTQAPFKPGSSCPSPVFEKIWCHLTTRPLNRLEELAFEYLELRTFGTTGPIEAGSPTAN